ncbi:MAG: enoyl-CoA hydratase, partial [Actinobacteria bacterium]|nr:enoyl-CoA hydratase [Actinomycetota bacterium]
MSETVHTQRHDRVLVVQIDREAKRNAIDPSVTAGIGAALDEL